jgi:hypothetical protein
MPFSEEQINFLTQVDRRFPERTDMIREIAQRPLLRYGIAALYNGRPIGDIIDIFQRRFGSWDPRRAFVTADLIVEALSQYNAGSYDNQAYLAGPNSDEPLTAPDGSRITHPLPRGYTLPEGTRVIFPPAILARLQQEAGASATTSGTDLDYMNQIRRELGLEVPPTPGGRRTTVTRLVSDPLGGLFGTGEFQEIEEEVIVPEEPKGPPTPPEPTARDLALQTLSRPENFPIHITRTRTVLEYLADYALSSDSQEAAALRAMAADKILPPHQPGQTVDTLVAAARAGDHRRISPLHRAIMDVLREQTTGTSASAASTRERIVREFFGTINERLGQSADAPPPSYLARLRETAGNNFGQWLNTPLYSHVESALLSGEPRGTPTTVRGLILRELAQSQDPDLARLRSEYLPLTRQTLERWLNDPIVTQAATLRGVQREDSFRGFFARLIPGIARDMIGQDLPRDMDFRSTISTAFFRQLDGTLAQRFNTPLPEGVSTWRTGLTRPPSQRNWPGFLQQLDQQLVARYGGENNIPESVRSWRTGLTRPSERSWQGFLNRMDVQFASGLPENMRDWRTRMTTQPTAGNWNTFLGQLDTRLRERYSGNMPEDVRRWRQDLTPASRTDWSSFLAQMDTQLSTTIPEGVREWRNSLAQTARRDWAQFLDQSVGVRPILAAALNLNPDSPPATRVATPGTGPVSGQPVLLALPTPLNRTGSPPQTGASVTHPTVATASVHPISTTAAPRPFTSRSLPGYERISTARAREIERAGQQFADVAGIPADQRDRLPPRLSLLAYHLGIDRAVRLYHLAQNGGADLRLDQLGQDSVIAQYQANMQAVSQRTGRTTNSLAVLATADYRTRHPALRGLTTVGDVVYGPRPQAPTLSASATPGQ